MSTLDEETNHSTQEPAMLPYDDSPCWSGQWASVAPTVDLWAHSAVVRTVAALPSLHAWRLGDDKGSRRSLVWSAAPTHPAEADADFQKDPRDGVAVLTQSAPPPSLPLGDVDADGEFLGTAALTPSLSMTGGLLSALATGLSRTTADAIADAVGPRRSDNSDPSIEHPAAEPKPFRPTDAGVRRWVGGMAQLPGAWLPELAILPRSRRDIDDPGTRWHTESVAFALRHSVHASDIKFASDVLAPHVTALILDHVPEDAAVTISGDAIHLWWEYTEQSRHAAGKAERTVEIAVRVRDALPSFVFADYPDHSRQVEARLSDRAARADAYRAGRVTGRHRDPTLQRIYAQAQATYQLGQREK